MGYGAVYYRNGVKGRWMRSNGNMRQITVGSKGRVFGTDRYHRIWTKVALKGNWKYIPGRLMWIASNAANQVTGTNRYTSIYFAVSQKKMAKKLAKRIMKAKNHKKVMKTKKVSVKAKKIMKKKVSKRIVKRMKKHAPKRVTSWLIRWRLRWAKSHHKKHRVIRRHYVNRYTWTTRSAILQIRNDRNHRNVDIWQGRPNRHQPVKMWNRHNGWNQRWRIVNVRGKYFQLKSLKGNKYFGSRGGYWAGLQNRATWLHYNTRFHSLMRGNKCLDIWHGNFNNGSYLVWWNCHHGMNQHFSLVWVGGHRVVRKHYVRRHFRHIKRKVYKRVFKYGWTGYHGWSAIAGRLRQVAIGKNGVQWGIATNDTIWTRSTGGWRHVNGHLHQIAVSDDGKVWGVNRAHYIFVLLNAARSQWKLIPGRLSQVSVGKNHNVWGVNRWDQIFVRIGGINGYWKYIPGRLTNVSVGYDGKVWGVNRYGYTYYRNGMKGGWALATPIIRMRQISAGSKGRVFATAKNDTIWTKVGLRGAWKNIPGRMRWIATNARNQVSGTNKYNRIYLALSGKGAKIVRKFSKRAIYHPKRIHKTRVVKHAHKKAAKIMKKKTISKRAKKVMKRKVSKRVFKRFSRKVSKKAKKMIKRRPTKRQSKKWFVHSRFGSWTGYKGWAAIGGRLRQVAIGKNGVQWGVAANDTIWTRKTSGGWRHVNGHLHQIAVSDDGKVWGVNRYHYIFVLLTAARSQWKVVSGRLTQLSVGKNHNV